MGMYTELVLKASVVSNLPQDVENVLQFLFNEGDEPAVLPQHEFFTLSRWQFIGRCSSYYHTPWATSKYAAGYIFSRSDLKNYSHEIQEFVKWISPYLNCMSGTCIGWQWYEEADMPDLLVKL